jgi:cell wall-associated NlpC family hydrolase
MLNVTHRININVADIRGKPKFKSERITQALYNEPIEILKKGDDYYQVKLHDGYRGYVKKLFISENDMGDGADYIISSPLAPAFAVPEENSPIVTILPFTAELIARGVNNNYMATLSPRYGDIYLRSSDLIPTVERPRLTRATVPQMLEIARQFIGVPYLWGGRSYFGADCSGFINVILGYFDLMMPRKTKDQVKFGRKVPYGEAEMGDLLFFRAHVGIALNRTDFIHCSLSQGGVHINSLDPHRPGYLRHRDLGLRAVRRFIPD